jgi:hypothetical protein
MKAIAREVLEAAEAVDGAHAEDFAVTCEHLAVVRLREACRRLSLARAGVLTYSRQRYNLEDYIRSQYAPEIGRIDFRFRASVTPEAVEIYVHPLNHSGDTTPTLVVEGDRVRGR